MRRSHREGLNSEVDGPAIGMGARSRGRVTTHSATGRAATGLRGKVGAERVARGVRPCEGAPFDWVEATARGQSSGETEKGGGVPLVNVAVASMVAPRTLRRTRKCGRSSGGGSTVGTMRAQEQGGHRRQAVDTNDRDMTGGSGSDPSEPKEERGACGFPKG